MNGATCYKSTQVVSFIIIDIGRFPKKKEYMQVGLPNPQTDIRLSEDVHKVQLKTKGSVLALQLSGDDFNLKATTISPASSVRLDPKGYRI